MSQCAEKLCFSVTGEFVTNTARDWFWAEKKPYKKVEEFLLACMCGTNHEKSTLLSLIRDVLIGRRKFIGSTSDDSFALVEDNTDIRYLYSNIIVLNTFEEVDRVLGVHIGNQEHTELQETVEELGQNEYGWLSPTGKFFAVPWAYHQEWAYNYVQEHFCADEVRIFYKNSNGVSPERSGDFLLDRGWILLHSPQQQEAHVTQNEIKPLTKAQKEFLFDYFTLRNRLRDAKRLYESN